MAKQPSCVGSSNFDPAALAKDPETTSRVASLLQKDDFAGAIKAYFSLPPNDTYAYHAISTVYLNQVQHIVNLGGVNGLHAWYAAPSSSSSSSSSSPPLPGPPSRQDVEAYISIFLPNTLTSSALKAFGANAKRDSIRASVAAHLTSKRYLHPGGPHLNIPKKKATAKDIPSNPYFDFWAWSCLNLEWCGPNPESEARSQSHHLLPVLMHHFGCAVPSYESLEVLRLVAAGRTVADVGSGNGYWAFMLRQHGVAVAPVDSAQSEWRATWVGDTAIMDGVKWLGRNGGGEDLVLLMVYPVVGGGAGGGAEGGFTRDLLKAYKGDTLAVVGTQNHNGYTSFRDCTLDEYMEREQPGWTKVVQIPLPSFAGKDEALFVYQRGAKLGSALNNAT